MFKLSEFGNRLNELMQDREINAPALAIKINTDRTNITRYLRGERTPKFTTFVNLINFFNCSADYLLGLDEIPKDNNTFLPNKPFDIRLREVLTNGKSQYGLMKEKKISSSILHDWLSGKRLPSIENLCKIAEYVECSVDFLLGREK